jgi:kinesin family protein 4/21/27
MSVSSKPGGSRASDEDSRTAVKVAVRVRPPLQHGEPGYELIPQRFRGALCHVTSPSSLTIDATGGKKVFVFDRVFGEDIEQEGVFEYVADSVHSFVQGYNVSILAYGQSGAGKSYTMGTTGPRDQADNDVMGMWDSGLTKASHANSY